MNLLIMAQIAQLKMGLLFYPEGCGFNSLMINFVCLTIQCVHHGCTALPMQNYHMVQGWTVFICESGQYVHAVDVAFHGHRLPWM